MVGIVTSQSLSAFDELFVTQVYLSREFFP